MNRIIADSDKISNTEWLRWNRAQGKLNWEGHLNQDLEAKEEITVWWFRGRTFQKKGSASPKVGWSDLSCVWSTLNEEKRGRGGAQRGGQGPEPTQGAWASSPCPHFELLTLVLIHKNLTVHFHEPSTFYLTTFWYIHFHQYFTLDFESNFSSQYFLSG